MATTPSGGIALDAEERTEFGKGAARRIRRSDKIPAVLYGHGEPVHHVTLPGHATMLALKHPNALLSLSMADGTSLMAIAKDVQVEPIRRAIEHVDLVIVRAGERVEVSVPVHVQGEVPGGVITLEANTVQVTALATDLPEQVTVDVEGLEIGAQLTVADLTLPQGAQAVAEPETTVLTVVAAPTAEEVDAEMEQAEAEAGIERDEKDVDDVAASAAPAGPTEDEDA